MEVSLPANEAERLAALWRYGVLDTPPETEFDDLVHLAAQICDTPFAAIGLVDEERHWFKAKVGCNFPEISRDCSFCAQTILSDDIHLIPNLLTDARFSANPFVTSDPHFRFYAGVPLLTSDGLAIGAICVLDTTPRQLSAAQQDGLQRLARQAMALLKPRLEQQKALETPTHSSASNSSELPQQSAITQVDNLVTAQQIAHLGSWEMGLSDLDDITANALHWSDELFRIFGYEPGEVKASHETFFKAVHPEDRQHLTDLMGAAIQGGPPYAVDHRIVLPNGQVRIVHAQAELIRDHETGRPLKMVGVGLDVTERKQAEAEQIRLAKQFGQERERWHNIISTIPGVVWESWLSAESSVQNAGFVNDYVTTLLGYSVEEWLSTPNFWLSIVHPEDRERAEAEGAAIVHYSGSGTSRYRWLTKNGRTISVETRIVVVRDEAGQPIGLRGVTIDISEQVKAEAALLQLHNELEQRVKERTAELLKSNRALENQIQEREEAEAESRTRARQQQAVAELGERALVGIELNDLLHVATELIKVTLDVEISSVLEITPDGQHLRYRMGSGWRAEDLGYLVPNNETSQGGYALRQNSPTVVENLPAETRFQPAPKLLRYGIVSGMTVVLGGQEQPFGTLGAHTTRSRAFSRDDVHFLQSVSNILSAAIDQRRIESEIRDLNAQLEETNEQLRIENMERQMIMGALREASLGFERAKVDAENARETAEQANRAKSEFLSRMSHELRTPLNAILGFGQILEEQDLPATAQESISYIMRGGNHLLDLVNEILDLARVEAGRLDLSLEPIALDEILAECCALVRPLAAEHGIRLTTTFSDAGQNFVLADRQRLKQVLLNILANGIKYNREGGRVDILCEPADDNMLAIAVKDTGFGISPQNLAKLFTPFERLDATNSAIEGTGLGLTLSKRLAEAMGGFLEVESSLGEGTVFTLRFPQSAPLQGKISPLAEWGEAPARASESDQAFTVLCIEDNPSNLRLIQAILTRRPEVTLLTAIQGSVGLDMARQHTPSLILLDLNLPDLHGREVLQRLQAGEGTRNIPVVIVSADATPNQIERLMDLGAKNYLTKPLNIRLFLQTLDQFLVPAGSSHSKDG